MENGPPQAIPEAVEPKKRKDTPSEAAGSSNEGPHPRTESFLKTGSVKGRGAIHQYGHWPRSKPAATEKWGKSQSFPALTIAFSLLS